MLFKGGYPELKKQAGSLLEGSMDLIADTLTRIRNAIMAEKTSVMVKYSKFIEEILKVLEREGYINGFNVLEDQYAIEVKLKYIDGKSVIEGLERISKPGRRVYVGKKDLPRVFNNLGIAILSTSKGVLTDREARELGIGGEYLCKIW